ncbi:MAG: NAD-dependent epimerase/dehydratase [Conexibacter sp.]|nr:NAD-dependent epimerase/dehydratase [Conexibacter sp.]
MATVFVTGAYGLLGSWLVRALVARGDRVVVLQRDRTPRSALLLDDVERSVDVVHGDLLDPGLLERALGEHEVDTVFHLAAQTIVGTANRSPLATFETNIRGTWTLLEACRSQAVARVVVAASDKAYGASATLPYRESDPLQPRFPYDVSKAATDLIARSYWHTFGLPVAVTRFANLYGGGDLNRSRLVPEAVAAVLAGRAPVIRSDGTPERDFLYVEDAVDAYLRIADALDDADPARTARGEAFNAGGGRPHAVRDVVALICAIAGTDVVPEIRGRAGTGSPRGEIDRQYVDAGKLRERTGWAPRVELEAGLRRTVDWYRAHPDALR